MSNLNFLHSGGNKVTLSAPTSDPSSNPNFKLPQADGSADQFLKTDGSGALSFANTYGPAFKAYRSSNLSISHNSNTPVVFQTEVFDTDNCYNNSNGVFTPNKAGYYYVHFSMRIDLVSADHLFQARINSGSSGANYIGIDQRFNKSSNANNSASVSVLHAFNGSGDSVFAQAYQNSGYTNTILGNLHETWFEAHWVRPL
jgi:hypothetical protein